ncbi:MAG: hypothetical protein ACRDM1_06000 [Gaiellaceae bacterium]
MIVEALLAGSIALSAPAGAERAPAPALALAASPQRLVVAAGSRGSVSVLNPGRAAVVVDATAVAYALDPHGRPRLGGAAVRWIAPFPRRLYLPPHGHATLAVSALRPRAVRPGDHATALLLTTRLAVRPAVRVRMRVGVVVVVRVPGRLRRQLVLGRPVVLRRGRARVLRLLVANRGNIDEWLPRSRLSVSLLRGRRVVAVLRAGGRRFLARSSGVIDIPVPRRVRGRLRAAIAIAPASRGAPGARRSGWLRF